MPSLGAMRVRAAASASIVLTVGVVAGCDRPAPLPFDLAAARKTIEANNERFTTAHLTGDVATIDAMFTQDARSLPPGAAPVIGIAAIHALTVDYVNLGLAEFSERTTAFYGNAEYLIDQGDYTVTYGKERTVEKGKYLNVWKQEQGVWKIHSNMWNTDGASAPPAS